MLPCEGSRVLYWISDWPSVDGLNRRFVGAWLILVERLVRDQEAGGSNPLAPTNSFSPLLVSTDNLPTRAAPSARQPNSAGMFHLRQHFLDELDWLPETAPPCRPK